MFSIAYRMLGSAAEAEDTARQLAVRARRRLDERRPRFEPSRQRRAELSERFFAAIEDGETDGFVELLAEDAVLYGDGGGKAPSIPRPIAGREQVAKVLAGFARQARTLGLRLEPAEVNGQPGGVARDADGLLVNVVSLEIADGRVHAVRSIVNPEKFSHL